MGVMHQGSVIATRRPSILPGASDEGGMAVDDPVIVAVVVHPRAGLPRWFVVLDGAQGHARTIRRADRRQPHAFVRSVG